VQSAVVITGQLYLITLLTEPHIKQTLLPGSVRTHLRLSSTFEDIFGISVWLKQCKLFGSVKTMKSIGFYVPRSIRPIKDFERVVLVVYELDSMELK